MKRVLTHVANWRTGRAVVTRMRELVVQFIITLANYEYVFAYKLDTAGGITLEVRATGIVSVVNIDPGKTSDYGNVVSNGVLAQNHQHIFAARKFSILPYHCLTNRSTQVSTPQLTATRTLSSLKSHTLHRGTRKLIPMAISTRSAKPLSTSPPVLMLIPQTTASSRLSIHPRLTPSLAILLGTNSRRCRRRSYWRVRVVFKRNEHCSQTIMCG
jgi:hypothetical protein